MKKHKKRWNQARVASAVVLLLVLASLGHFAYATATLLLKDPPPWPDESLFANPAIRLIEQGRMGTNLLTNLLPGIGMRTFWVPPLHILATAGVFRVAGPGILQMRLISVAAAILILLLTYRLARRLGMERPLAALSLCAVALDPVFLRGSRIGRMDMLALLLVMTSICLTMRREDGHRTHHPASHPFLGGVAAGLAILTHPIGLVSTAGLAIGLALFPPGRKRPLLPFLSGAALPLIPWLVYIMGDPAGFWAQVHCQIVRKGTRPSISIAGMADSLLMNLHQYGRARMAARGLWLLGSAGLLAFALRSRSARPMAIASLLVAGFVLVGREMWYPIYLVPFLAIGTLSLVAIRPRLRGMRPALATVVFLLLAWFARESVVQQRRLDRKWNKEYAVQTDFRRFCSEISAALPFGSTVILALIPDPYLGLLDRADLTLRSFAPDEMPMPAATWNRFLQAADYVILGDETPSRVVRSYAEAAGEVVCTIGDPQEPGYRARIYRLNPGTGDNPDARQEAR